MYNHIIIKFHICYFLFLDTWKNNSYNKVQFSFMGTTMKSIVEINNYIDNNFVLQNVTILGVVNGPLSTQVNGFSFNHYFHNKTEQVS